MASILNHGCLMSKQNQKKIKNIDMINRDILYQIEIDPSFNDWLENFSSKKKNFKIIFKVIDWFKEKNENNIIITASPNIYISLFNDGSFQITTNDEIITQNVSGQMTIISRKTNKQFKIRKGFQIEKFSFPSNSNGIIKI